MSTENLEKLINKAEAIEKGDQETEKKFDPDYQSADDIRADCRKKAEFIVHKYCAAAMMIKPEAALQVFSEQKVNQGIDRLADVLQKYPSAGELPAWITDLFEYKEIFLCGIWAAGTGYGLYQADQAIKAEQAAQAEAAAAAESETDKKENVNNGE